MTLVFCISTESWAMLGICPNVACIQLMFGNFVKYRCDLKRETHPGIFCHSGLKKLICPIHSNKVFGGEVRKERMW